MIALDPIRKACPACGKPMAAASGDVAEGRQRYDCANCDDDPLHDPIARKWADGPLRPPAKWSGRQAQSQRAKKIGFPDYRVETPSFTKEKFRIIVLRVTGQSSVQSANAWPIGCN